MSSPTVLSVSIIVPSTPDVAVKSALHTACNPKRNTRERAKNIKLDLRSNKFMVLLPHIDVLFVSIFIVDHHILDAGYEPLRIKHQVSSIKHRVKI